MEHQDKVNFQDSTEVQLSSISEEERARERVLASPLSAILKNFPSDTETYLIDKTLDEVNKNAQNESPPSS